MSYFAGNKFEGCGHRHYTAYGAQRCLPKIDRKHGVVSVWLRRPGMKAVRVSVAPRSKVKPR